MIFVRRLELSDTDREEIKNLAKKAGLNIRLAEILYSRGIRTPDGVRDFLNPSEECLHDPYLMKGMREAVSRIEEAIESGERIAVYGDYDVDGISATAILTMYLVDRGVEVFPYIPNRISDGYGLNIDSLERLLESSDISLIITCDCGISGAAEVDHLIDLGVDVIVTDHHEIGGIIPDCVVVDAKQEDCSYPYKQLCGAGVALKLVEALGGKAESAKYMYLAAIASIADLVPLEDENRLIVQMGLRQLAGKPNLGISMLLQKLGVDIGTITAQDIAYKLSPHINAAGRMGDAYRAFELLVQKDKAIIDGIIDEIIKDNLARKAACDIMYNEAKAIIADKRLALNPALVIMEPSWERGITGIVAARLAGEYCRPVFLLVAVGDGQLKGTARSYSDINIHSLLSDTKDILTEFGGHSAAA